MALGQFLHQINQEVANGLRENPEVHATECEIVQFQYTSHHVNMTLAFTGPRQSWWAIISFNDDLTKFESGRSGLMLKPYLMRPFKLFKHRLVNPIVWYKMNAQG